MEDLPFEMPQLDRGIKRTLFRLTIGHKPTKIIFRGQEITARVSEPSQKRKIELAGYEVIADLMCDIALEVGANPPEAEKDRIKIGNITYRISETQSDLGNDCYTLTLARQ